MLLSQQQKETTSSLFPTNKMTNFLKKVLKKCLCRRPEEGHDEDGGQEEPRLAPAFTQPERTAATSEMLAFFDRINSDYHTRIYVLSRDYGISLSDAAREVNAINQRLMVARFLVLQDPNVAVQNLDSNGPRGW